jgi:short repeat uncharacterized protein DUF308
MSTTPPPEPAVEVTTVDVHRSWPWVLAFGILALIAGLITLVWRGVTVLALVFVLGVFLIVAGGAEIGWSIAERHTEGWGFILFRGIVDLIAGIVVLAWPDVTALVGERFTNLWDDLLDREAVRQGIADAVLTDIERTRPVPAASEPVIRAWINAALTTPAYRAAFKESLGGVHDQLTHLGRLAVQRLGPAQTTYDLASRELILACSLTIQLAVVRSLTARANATQHWPGLGSRRGWISNESTRTGLKPLRWVAA